MTQEYDYTCVMVTTYNLERQVQELYYTRGINVDLSRINGIIAELNTVTTVVLCQTQYQAFDEMMRFAGKIIQNINLRNIKNEKHSEQVDPWCYPGSSSPL